MASTSERPRRVFLDPYRDRVRRPRRSRRTAFQRDRHGRRQAAFCGLCDERRQHPHHIRPRQRRRMKRESITRFSLDKRKPPKTDWRGFDAMSEDERHRAALSDPDAAPANGRPASGRDTHANGARVAQETQPDTGGIRSALTFRLARSEIGSRARTDRPGGVGFFSLWLKRTRTASRARSKTDDNAQLSHRHRHRLRRRRRDHDGAAPIRTSAFSV